MLLVLALFNSHESTIFNFTILDPPLYTQLFITWVSLNIKSTLKQILFATSTSTAPSFLFFSNLPDVFSSVFGISVVTFLPLYLAIH